MRAKLCPLNKRSMPEVTTLDLMVILGRVEDKLDALILALAEDGDDPNQMYDMDGNPLPAERDQTQSLG